MRQYTPQQVEALVERMGVNLITGDGDMPSPANIAYLLMDEVGRIQQGVIDDETVALMLAAATLLVAYATEQMAADEERVGLLLRSAKSKYLRFSYSTDAVKPTSPT
ncbi:MAG: hypothetical protein WA049_06520 [Ferribacterium limneticum]